MPQKRRIDLPGGTYYVVRRTHCDWPVFSSDRDYGVLQELMPDALKRSDAQLLAYCWMPDAIHMVLRMNSAGIGNFMRYLTSHFAQRVQRRSGRRGQFFRRRYQSTLLEPQTYLLPVMRYIHHLPVAESLASEPHEYPFSSVTAYLGESRQGWVSTAPVLELLDRLPDGATRQQLVTEPPPEIVRDAFDCRQSETPSILGSPEFLGQLPRQLSPPARSRRSIEEIADYVCTTQGITHQQLVSRSRRRQLVLARALVAWYATERRVATLRAVSEYLHHSPSGLSRAVAAHQARYPQLFTFATFRALTPLAPIASSRETRLRQDERTLPIPYGSIECDRHVHIGACHVCRS